MAIVDGEHEELLSARVAILATNGRDGRPQLSPVWFLVEDDLIKISVTAARQKTRNLSRDARCTFLAFHPSSANYYIEVRDEAALRPDPDYSFADRIGAKYQADLRDFDAPDDSRVVVTITPSRVNIIDVRD